MRMFVGVQVRRSDACGANFFDLRPHFDFNLLGWDHSGAEFGNELRQGLGQIASRVSQRCDIFLRSNALSADQN